MARIDQDEVGVAPGAITPFRGWSPKIRAAFVAVIGGEPLERHPALDDAFRERDPQARLGAEVAAGHVLDRPPRSFIARLVGYSSVASVETPPSTSPRQSASRSSGSLSDGYVWAQKPRGVL